MSEENVEIVRALFDTFARRDHEAAFDYYDAEIEWDPSRAGEGAGIAAVYHGHGGVRAYWRRWLSAWEDVEATEVEFVDAGQTVVALIHQQRLRGRGSGIEVDAPPYALSFTLRNGKVVRWVLYPTQTEAPRSSRGAGVALWTRSGALHGGQWFARDTAAGKSRFKELPMEGDAGAFVASFYEKFDRNDIDAAVERFSEELETVDPGMGTVHGIEPFREYLETFKRAMPDARAIIEHQYESGDTVIVEGRFVGTHTGPLAGDDGDVDPTGRSVDLRFADFSRVSNGKITSYHTYYDQVGLLTQLGLMDDS